MPRNGDDERASRSSTSEVPLRDDWAVLESSPLPMGIVQRDGRTGRANAALRALAPWLGGGPARDGGLRWVDLARACDRACDAGAPTGPIVIDGRAHALTAWAVGDGARGAFAFALGEAVRDAPAAPSVGIEASLAEAERVAGVGHWRWRVTTNELQWSEQIYRIFGLDPTRTVATYEAFLDRVHPDDRAKVQAAVDAALADALPYDIDHRIVRPDGAVRVVNERAEVAFGPDGRPEVMFGTVHDVTDRTSVVETLRVSEARFRQVLEAAPDALVIADRGGAITMANSMAAQKFGYPPSELLGKPLDSLIREGAGALAFAAAELARGGEGGPNAARAVQGLRADGSRIPLEVRTSVLSTPEGELTISSMRDVSERIDLETQLRQAQKMEALGRLAAGIAHDFNNVLTIINGYASVLLADPSLPPAHVADLQEILDAGHSAADLTGQLLTMGRKQVLSLGPVDLNGVVRGIGRMLRRTLGDAITLQLRLERELPPVRADAGRLEQVVLNLAVNARDAMPQGGILSFETGLQRLGGGDREGQRVLLLVRDTGMGMDGFTLDRIFDPFFTTKPEGRGTGLGLATVHGIVQQLGGTIEAKSRPGAGALFRIALPVDGGAAKPRAVAMLEAAGDDPAARVLVVDDDERLGTMVRRILRTAGHDVRFVRSAAEARAALDAEGSELDLMILDVSMPGETGPALMNLLRPRFPDLPVLFMSGHAVDDPELEEGPLRRFLAKPFDADELLRAVGAMLADVGLGRS